MTDDVVDGPDGRWVKPDAKLGQDRDEGWPESVEGLRGLPDVEQLDLAVRVERVVVGPSRGCPVTGRGEARRRIASSYFSGVKPLCLK